MLVRCKCNIVGDVEQAYSVSIILAIGDKSEIGLYDDQFCGFLPVLISGIILVIFRLSGTIADCTELFIRVVRTSIPFTPRFFHMMGAILSEPLSSLLC